MIEQILNKEEKSAISRNILESLIGWFESEGIRKASQKNCHDYEQGSCFSDGRGEPFTPPALMHISDTSYVKADYLSRNTYNFVTVTYRE